MNEQKALEKFSKLWSALNEEVISFKELKKFFLEGYKQGHAEGYAEATTKTSEEK